MAAEGVMHIDVKLHTQCRFCSGTFSAGYEAGDKPCLTHSHPPCDRFMALEIDDFLVATRQHMEAARTVVVNRRVDVYDVYIGRGSQWGNPYIRHGQRSSFADVRPVDDPIAEYEVYVRRSKALMDDLSQLRGKRLGCYCKPKPCHGDVLVKLVKERYA